MDIKQLIFGLIMLPLGLVLLLYEISFTLGIILALVAFIDLSDCGYWNLIPIKREYKDGVEKQIKKENHNAPVAQWK